MKSEEEGGLILRHKESMLVTNVTEDEIEFRNSLNIDQDKFKSEKIHCTACNKNLKDKIMSKLEIYIHPALQVSVCKSCFKFYGTGAFTTDEDGTDMFCRWCGQGGELICCSRCTVVMCIKCIELNFPKEYRKETEKDDWCCFICDTKPIWPIRALAAAASEYVESQKKNQMSKRRGIDKDDAVPKKSRRNDSSESEEATEPTYSKRNKKKYEGTSSKRLRRNKSDDDEFLEPKRSSRLRRKGSREEYYTDSSSTEAKTKRRKPTSLTSDTNSNDSDSSRKGRFHKSKATTKSPRKTSRSLEEKVENESPSKNELSALLQHHIIESVADYNKLIKVMMKSRKDYVNEYLQNKKLWKNDDGKQTLIDKYKELLAKTKDSMDKLECTFLTSMKKLNLFSTKEEDETKQIAEANQILNNEMDVSSTDVETIRVNEHQSSMDPSKILDVISTDVTHTETTCESKSQQSMDSSKVLDKETDSMNVTDLETTHENENQQSMDPSRILDKETDSMNVTDIEMTRIDDEDISNMSNEESNIFDSESNTVENQDKASDSNEIIAKKALLDSPKDPHASPSAESNTVKKQDEASDSDEIIAKKALLDSPEDPHASPGAESNTVKKQDKASDSDEIIAKKALLDSPEDPLASSNAEESENDTKASPNDTKASPSKETIAKAVQLESLKEPLVSPNEEEMAKAALLESSDADIGNDEELKSSDSASSGICKLDGNKSQQSRKRRSKTLKKSETNKNTDDEDDKEIDRLTSLQSLHRIRKKCLESDDENDHSTDSEKENRMNTTDNRKKLSLRTKPIKKSLADFISDGSDTGDERSDNEEELTFDSFNILQDKKARDSTMNKEALSKKLLLMDSNSDDNENDSDSDSNIKDLINKSNEMKNKQKNDSSSKKSEKELDNSDDSDTFETKPKKKTASWRNDKLLRGKLSDPDTSDDERAIKKARLKDHVEKQKRAAKGSESSDSEDLFRPNLSSQRVCKRKIHFSSSGSDATAEVLSNSSSLEIISDVETTKSRKPTKKKRKRVRGAWESSNSDGSAENTSKTGSASKGRKNIRKIIGEEDLEEMTRKTARAEADRKKRLAEKQALFDQSFKMPDDNDSCLDELVLDFDPETKEEIISVHPKLLKKLKPHQAKGVKFMWDSCFESVKQIKKNQEGGGCILAHCMGLGKTLQVITLVHTVLRYSELTNIKKVLVICPLSTVLNWVHEFDHWLRNTDDYDFDVDHLTKHKNNAVRADYLRKWFRDGGVMILGYDMFRNLVNNKKLKTSIKNTINEALLDPGPDLVICDEGHILKNVSSGVSLATTQIKTLRRIVLTGTPLQNNLSEYHCMVHFVKPNLLGTKKEFQNRFVNPITNGQYTNSTEKDVKVMKRRAHVLHKMLDGIVQRFDYKVLMPFLPPKHEFVISVALSDLQAKLYDHYIKHYSRMSNSTTSLFKDYQVMRLIWTHPLAMKLAADRSAKVKHVEDDNDSLKDFIVSGSDGDSSSQSDNSVISCNSGTSVAITKNPSRKKKKDKNEDDEALDPDNNVVNPWWSDFISSEDVEDYKQGPKLVLLFAVLRECENRGDKVLIFSQSIPSLDMIEYFLEKSEELSQYAPFLARQNFSHVGNWRKNADYFRLDGSTPNDVRAKHCNAFNKESNKRARLFLISTKAGGLGINLTAANRVIIFDASWNPSHDVQSIFRVFRFGQSKPCYIYRFLSQGTMEEKIYERQVTKLSISCRVVDEQQIDRHFSRNEIETLYAFNRIVPDENETPKLPNDDLMAELLKQYKKYIVSYHEHDSLLENIVDEELTEEERKQAWEEYENDKKPKLPGLPTRPVIPDEQIIAAVLREHPTASGEVLKLYAARVRMKLEQQLAQQHHQQAMQTQMNNAYFAQQNELANMQKSAFRYQLQQQMLNQRKENQPPAVNQVTSNTGFESPRKTGFNTPKKMAFHSPPKYSNASPLKSKDSPFKTPTKHEFNFSNADEDASSIKTDSDPLKTPQTWAFKWNNVNNLTRLVNVLKSNCQWNAARHEEIGDFIMMHLPYCVRRETLEKKLSEYLPYLQFNRITPYVDEEGLVEVIVQAVVSTNITNI